MMRPVPHFLGRWDDLAGVTKRAANRCPEPRVDQRRRMLDLAVDANDRPLAIGLHIVRAGAERLEAACHKLG